MIATTVRVGHLQEREVLRHLHLRFAAGVGHRTHFRPEMAAAADAGESPAGRLVSSLA